MSVRNPESSMSDSQPLAADSGHQSDLGYQADDLPRQVGLVFRHLSDEHIEGKRRDDPEATWRSIERRLNLDSSRVHGTGRLARLAGGTRRSWASAGIAR